MPGVLRVIHASSPSLTHVVSMQSGPALMCLKSNHFLLVALRGLLLSLPDPGMRFQVAASALTGLLLAFCPGLVDCSCAYSWTDGLIALHKSRQGCHGSQTVAATVFDSLTWSFQGHTCLGLVECLCAYSWT